MQKAPVALRVLLLCLAGTLVMATGSFPEPENPRRTDETWLVTNVWDGQTSVDPQLVIQLTLGERDFRLTRQADGVLTQIVLRNTDTGERVPVRFDITWESTFVVPTDGLEPDTDYELDLDAVQGRLYSTRGFPPGPVRFSTRVTPRVVGLYKTETFDGPDTLLVLFSQPMHEPSLFISQESVDLIWQDGASLRSLAADENLAGYAWDTVDHLFLLAPFDPRPEMWLKISATVQGLNGAELDGDGDGIGGTAWDDYLSKLQWPPQLPLCFAREDIPQPCISSEHIPELNW